jgi:soluble lytic murein transglycosylase-like protein
VTPVPDEAPELDVLDAVRQPNRNRFNERKKNARNFDQGKPSLARVLM